MVRFWGLAIITRLITIVVIIRLVVRVIRQAALQGPIYLMGFHLGSHRLRSNRLLFPTV